MKKGELTTKQIIGLVILLVSFVVILILYIRLDIGGETDEEICHNSIVMASNKIIPTEAIEIKCSTKYICLTADGSCDELTSPDETIDIDFENEVYFALAEEMANCWWMFGRGEKSYVADEITKQNHCSICSQIYFDDSLTEISGFEKGKISKDELYEYLSETERIDGDENYLQYLLGTNDLEKLKSEIVSNEDNTEQIGTFGNILIGEHYFVVMGIRSEVNTFGWVVRGAAVGGVAVVTLATFGIGAAGFTAVLIGEVAGGVGGALVGSELAEKLKPEIGALIVEGQGIDNVFMAPTIIEANSEKFDSLNCEDVLTTS